MTEQHSRRDVARTAVSVAAGAAVATALTDGSPALAASSSTVLAVVSSRGYALNVLARGLGDGLWEVWADYEHSSRMTGGRWVCDGMTARLVHARGNEMVRNAPAPS
jgi:hypothetical protein